MSFYGEGDLPAMISEFGRPITLGGDTVDGIIDQPDEEFLQQDGAGLIGKAVAVTIKTGDLPSLANGASIDVDGDTYQVDNFLAIADGALTRILCVKV